jgi:hypothetical protein
VNRCRVVETGSVLILIGDIRPPVGSAACGAARQASRSRRPNGSEFCGNVSFTAAAGLAGVHTAVGSQGYARTAAYSSWRAKRRLNVSLINPGFPFPAIAFIVWPTKNPNSLFFPDRIASTLSG